MKRGRAAPARPQFHRKPLWPYFHLLKDNGRWWIVSKLWDAEPVQ